MAPVVAAGVLSSTSSCLLLMRDDCSAWGAEDVVDQLLAIADYRGSGLTLQPRQRRLRSSGRLPGAAGRRVGEVETRALIEELVDVDGDREGIDERDGIGRLLVPAGQAIVHGRKRRHELMDQGPLRRERDSAPRPMRESMHVPAENVPDRDLWGSGDELRHRPLIAKSDSVEDRHADRTRRMMHGEERRPARKAPQGCVEPVEAGAAEASAVHAWIEGVDEDERADRGLVHALNEARGVDGMIGKCGAKRGPVVVVSHEQAIRRLELVDRPTQRCVRLGLAVLAEIAG
jgi:hypothetical protein